MSYTRSKQKNNTIHISRDINKNEIYDIDDILRKVFDKVKKKKTGKLADYIPELAKVDPNIYSITVVTCCGKIYKIGDYKKEVAIESIAKVFTLCLALDQYNQDYISDKIGTQTSFMPFNSVMALKLSENHTINPFVNAGAMATVSLIKGKTKKSVWRNIYNNLCNFAGRKLKFNKKIYKSESDNDEHNIALAYLLKSYDKFYNNIEDSVDVYTKQSSVMVNSNDLAIMAAALANDGVNPITQKRVFSKKHVPFVLSTMLGGGVYNYSGKWMNEVGLPAKSGVGGGLIGVVPGNFGIAVVSPPLDKNGNSSRGIATFRELSRRMNLNIFHETVKCKNQRCIQNDKCNTKKSKTKKTKKLRKLKQNLKQK